jgi:hypothetical protein
MPRNSASLSCVAPIERQFLQVAGEPTVLVTAFSPSLPAATSTRKSGFEYLGSGKSFVFGKDFVIQAIMFWQ